ncbi:MAG: hypothetical protein FWH50_03485 [Coriobacteriia bacterium]|nr:hypothetical protein [Coriobacteriia bacterium]
MRDPQYTTGNRLGGLVRYIERLGRAAARSRTGSSHSQASSRSIRLSLALLMALGTGAFALSACGDLVSAKTYSVKNWSDVQDTIDGASSGDIFDFSGMGMPDTAYTFSIPANLALTLKGDPEVTYIGVAFNCIGSNVITIDNLNLVSTGNQNFSTLHFSGKSNQLMLLGDSSIANAQAPAEIGYGAAIGVPEGVALVITGSGSLVAAGGSSAAGIGGGAYSACGNITVNGGSIAASGGSLEPGSGAAAIGGGAGGSAGAITIRGGSIYALATDGAAAIGGGVGSSGGNIAISGGTITARGISGAVGLGDGVQGYGASITMTKGTLTVIGDVDTGTASINGNIESLPTAYQWWAARSFASESDAGNSYPENAYVNDSTYGFIIIKSR